MIIIDPFTSIPVILLQNSNLQIESLTHNILILLKLIITTHSRQQTLHISENELIRCGRRDDIVH